MITPQKSAVCMKCFPQGEFTSCSIVLCKNTTLQNLSIVLQGIRELYGICFPSLLETAKSMPEVLQTLLAGMIGIFSGCRRLAEETLAKRCTQDSLRE